MRRFLLVFVFVCAACTTAYLPPPLASDAVTGAVVVVRGVEESRFSIDRCVAGEHEMFYGFDLGSADSKLALRAVVDPIGGPLVRVATATGEYVLRKAECETLRVDVRPTGWRINDVRDFAGGVVIDCRAGDAQIRADVRISACH